MAELQKEPSSVEPKEKNSLLADEDIGKEFLSSWKSMSVTEDNTMDFSFDTVSKGNKKKFNFEKMDLDFNLDGDFGKFSSFKVDMPDLDFSSPPKKTTKPKERSEEGTSKGNHQGKADPFSFSFDFNELDTFNFDPSLVEGEKTSKKNLDSKAVVSDKFESQGSKIHLAEGIGELNNTVNTKIPVSVGVVTSKVGTLVGCLEELSFVKDNFPSKSVTSGTPISSHGEQICPDQAFAKSAEKADLQGQKISTETYAQEAIHDLPVQSVSGNDATQNTVSEVHGEDCSSGTKEDTNSGEEQPVCHETTGVIGFNHKNSQWNDSPPVCITRSESTNTQRGPISDNLIENMCDTEPFQIDLHLEDASTTSALGKMLYDTKCNGETQNSLPKLLSTPLGSEPMHNKQTPAGDKEAKGICSKFFNRSEDTGRLLHQDSSPVPKVISVSGKIIGTEHTSPADEKREVFTSHAAETGSKFVGKSNVSAKELIKGEVVLLASEQNVRNLSGIRESLNRKGAQKREVFTSHAAETGSKFVGKSNVSAKELIKGEVVLLASEQNVRNLSGIRESLNRKGAQNGSKLAVNSRAVDSRLTTEEPVMLGSAATSSSKVNSSCSSENIKYKGQTCVNPKLVVSSIESIQNSKIALVERNDLCALKAGKRSPDILSLKTPMTIGSNKDLSTCTPQREIKSFKNSEKKMELQGKAVSAIEHPVTEKQVRLTPFLKRKSFEGLNANFDSLNPLKRLTGSPRRILKEASSKNPEEQVDNHEKLVASETNNVLCDLSFSELESPQEVDMTELEIPLVMGNDGNVEKAEAYSKGLENICNMLRKKHDEAKEILVRAIVNNNNLLMLSHPIYDEKIGMIQKFAARLMSKELSM